MVENLEHAIKLLNNIVALNLHQMIGSSTYSVRKLVQSIAQKWFGVHLRDIRDLNNGCLLECKH